MSPESALTGEHWLQRCEDVTHIVNQDVIRQCDLHEVSLWRAYSKVAFRADLRDHREDENEYFLSALTT
jgi:hypothetical protein